MVFLSMYAIFVACSPPKKVRKSLERMVVQEICVYTRAAPSRRARWRPQSNRPAPPIYQGGLRALCPAKLSSELRAPRGMERCIHQLQLRKYIYGAR